MSDRPARAQDEVASGGLHWEGANRVGPGYYKKTGKGTGVVKQKASDIF